MNTSIIKELKEEGFEIFSIEEIKNNNSSANYSDNDLIIAMEKYGAEICLYNPYMARHWFFKDEESLINYFENGGQVGFDNAETLIESVDEFDIEWEKMFSKTRNKVLSGEKGLEELRKMRDFVNRWKTNA